MSFELLSQELGWGVGSMVERRWVGLDRERKKQEARPALGSLASLVPGGWLNLLALQGVDISSNRIINSHVV